MWLTNPYIIHATLRCGKRSTIASLVPATFILTVLYAGVVGEPLTVEGQRWIDVTVSCALYTRQALTYNCPILLEIILTTTEFLNSSYTSEDNR